MPDTHSLSIADSRTYSISELAREFGITPRALRFYEDKDMLHPARDGMTRVYSHRDRGRVKIIVRLKRLGLPLADIREILDERIMIIERSSEPSEEVADFLLIFDGAIGI